jgi:hypothetical protein
MRAMVDEALEEVSPLFAELYTNTRRPSIPPERLLRALAAPDSFSVRSERQLMEDLEYNLLYRWFVGLGMDDAAPRISLESTNAETSRGGLRLAEDGRADAQGPAPRKAKSRLGLSLHRRSLQPRADANLQWAT